MKQQVELDEVPVTLDGSGGGGPGTGPMRNKQTEINVIPSINSSNDWDNAR